MSTDTLERPKTSDADTTDGDGLQHYFEKKDFDRAFFEGLPITALCGYTTVPMRDTKGLPVCDKCKFIYENIVQKG